MSEGISADLLFVGLTRPPTIFGVSFKFAMLNVMISSVFFIQKGGIKVIFLSIILHIIGYIMCFSEPRFMEIYANKLSNFNSCRNKYYYRANSYHA